MTANHEHTPTTVHVRLAATSPNEKFSLKGTDFDRWLAARDARIRAAAEQRGAARALRRAAFSPRLRDAVHYAIKHEKYADAARRSFQNYLLQEANRADQEADDE